jgi:methionine synthase II (cobalamin-independent)
MFSTLLGRLPSATGPGDDAEADLATVLGDLAGVGLEFLATGGPRPDPDADPAVVVAAWEAAAAATDRPVKQVLQGPYSAGRDGSRTRPTEIAERLRTAVEALTAAGCPLVEIEEADALAITVVDGERRRFAEAHRALTTGAAPETHRSLALTGGNFDTAGAATFFDLPYASYAFDLIAGPDNWRLIAAAPADRGIVCGALDPAERGDETRELLVWAAHYAASTSGRGLARIGLANAPSLGDLPWSVALRKLGRVAEAAGIAGVESSREMASLLDTRAFGGRRNRPGVVGLEAAEPE